MFNVPFKEFFSVSSVYPTIVCNRNKTVELKRAIFSLKLLFSSLGHCIQSVSGLPNRKG